MGRSNPTWPGAITKHQEQIEGAVMETKIFKVVVADSHEIVREAVSQRISESCFVEVVAQTSDGYGAIRACRQLKPDILLIDLSICHPSGMDTLTRLRESSPDLKLIVVSNDTSVSNAFLALSRGAVAFMSKAAKGADYVNAVNAAISGYTYVPVDVLEKFVKSRRNLSRNGNIFGLSSREIEILEASVSGLSTKQVAANLCISVRTVETHRHSIYRKTDCRDIEGLSRLMVSVSSA
jgi:DNA-binding NarL/FixJ family response regulator